MDKKLKIWLSIGIISIILIGVSTFLLFKKPVQNEIKNETNISDEGIRHEAPPIDVSKLNSTELEYYNKYYVAPTPNSVCGARNLTTVIEKDQYGNPLELCILPDNSSCVVYYVYTKDLKMCPQLNRS